MRKTAFSIVFVCITSLTGCSQKFSDYDGPQVTRIEILKEQRVLKLYSGQEVIKKYDVELGFAPVGDKLAEGDGKTPEGNYMIDRRNPNSAFYLSVGISYPNKHDIAAARRLGLDPGGDIFIHGQPGWFKKTGADWTAGCIAVKNSEIREIYAMVDEGTEIDLLP